MRDVRRAGTAASLPPAVLMAVAAGLVTLALGIYARHAKPSILDTPLIGHGTRSFYLIALVAVVGIGWQAHRFFDRPIRGYTPYPPLATAGILPAMIVLASALLVGRYHTAPIVVMAAVLAATGAYAALSIRDVIDSGDTGDQPVLLIHVGLSLVVVFVNVALLLQFQARLLFLAPTIFVVTALLLLQVHDGVPTYPVRRQAYALVGALIAAEVVWPLTYWPPLGWWSGAVVASVVTGYALVTRANLMRRLTGVAAAQYAGLTAALLVFVVVMSR